MNCYICPNDKYIDDHHIDCKGGKVSSETVPLCRRCHRTYHDLGVEWFDDEYLDKAIELENRRRQIVYDSLKSPTTRLVLLERGEVKRTDYWYKQHGIPVLRLANGGEPKVLNSLSHVKDRDKLARWLEWAAK